MKIPELSKQPCWPDHRQRLLLTAALAEDDEALEAWRAWKPAISLKSVDFASYRLLPMVYRNLQSFHGVDPYVDRLKPVVVRTGERNGKSLAAAFEVVDALDRSGIRALFTKGAPLAMRYYPDIDLRPMGDIDLLVPFDAAEDAIGALRQLGFTTSYRVSPENIPLRHSFDFFNDDGVGIDLHWYLLAECCSPHAQHIFWEGCESFSYGDRTLNCLCATDALFQVLVHGSRWDILPPTQWVPDAHVLLSDGSIEWERLVNLATTNRLILQVKFALEFYSGIIPGRVPGEIIDQLAGAPVSASEEREYYLRSTPVNYLKRLVIHWYSYKRYVGGSGNTGISFIDYLSGRWGLDRFWQMPLFVFRELLHRRKNRRVLSEFSL